MVECSEPFCSEERTLAPHASAGVETTHSKFFYLLVISGLDQLHLDQRTMPKKLDLDYFNMIELHWREDSQCILNFSNGIRKLHYLTDFVFAGLGKDFGLIGHVLSRLALCTEITFHIDFDSLKTDVPFCSFAVDIISVAGGQSQE